MRRLFWALLLAVALVAGMVGYALADVPDAIPSSQDPTHTLYGCYFNSGAVTRDFRILDKDLGNCPTNWVEVRMVPAVTPPR